MIISCIQTNDNISVYLVLPLKPIEMIIVLLIDDCYKLLGTKRIHDIVILKRSFIEPKEIDRFINKYIICTMYTNARDNSFWE